MKQYIINSIIVCAVATLTNHTPLGAVTSADQQAEKIESVLDKLETKYLDREATPLTYDEQRTPQAALPKKPVESITVKEREPIQGQTPNQKVLKDIQVKIGEYENQIDSLEADARKMKGQLIEGSRVDNLITVEARLKDNKTSGIQALTAKIDGSMLFNQTDPAGMWIPSSSIPIYHGPMQPGEHTIDVVAVLSRANENGLAVAGWTPQQVSKSFKISVPDGQTKKTLIIELDTASDRSGKAVANLVEPAPASATKESK